MRFRQIVDHFATTVCIHNQPSTCFARRNIVENGYFWPILKIKRDLIDTAK